MGGKKRRWINRATRALGGAGGVAVFIALGCGEAPRGKWPPAAGGVGAWAHPLSNYHGQPGISFHP